MANEASENNAETKKIKGSSARTDPAVEDFMNRVNDKNFGKKITKSDVVAYFINKSNDADVYELKLQSAETEEDRARMIWEKEMQATETKIDFVTWLIRGHKVGKQVRQ